MGDPCGRPAPGARSAMIAPLVRKPGDHKGRPYSSHKSTPTRSPYLRGPRRVSPSRAAIVVVSGVDPTRRSTRKRVWPDLQLEHFGLRVDATFAVEVGAGAGRGPQAPALPAAVRIVDAAVGVLGEEAHRIGNPQRHELAVNDRGQRFPAVGRGDRHVRAEPQRVEAVDPDIIGVLGAALVGDALELRTWELVEGPALRTQLAGDRFRSVDRLGALLAIEARHV